MLLILSACFLYAGQFDLSAGLAYDYYGFHAEEGTVKLDARYNSLGLDLGGAYRMTPEWEIRSNLYLGIPLSGAIYLDGELFNEPDLSQYDMYSYYFNFSAGPAYRLQWDRGALSLGAVLVLNDFVLASYESEPGYVLSYTAGLGGLGHFEYYIRDWTLYADLKGAVNFLEILVTHDDFSYAYGAGLSLGLLWRL